MAFFFIKKPPPSEVPYDGHLLPRDAQPIKTIVPPDQISYAGHLLPRDAQTPAPFVDNFNTPSYISLDNGTYISVLPRDTVITLNGKKVLVQTKILDGVSVFEHISRDPYRIEFSGTFRMQNRGGTTYNGVVPPSGLSGPVNNVFAQQALNQIWTNVWIPDTIMKISNSYLNGLGIYQMIVETMDPEVVRGSTNIPFRLAGWENVVGQSLIIS